MSHLETILKIPEQKKEPEQKVTIRGRQDKIPEPVFTTAQLLALQNLAGGDRAIELLTQYGVDELLAGEKALAQLELPLVPTEGYAHLEAVVEFIDLVEEYPALKTTSNTWSDAALSIEDLWTVLEMGMDAPSNSDRGWYFFRDGILQASREFLGEYGVPIEEGMETDGLFRGLRYREQKILPDTPREEFLKAIFDHGESNMYNIPKGFDNWRVALRFLELERERNSRKPKRRGSSGRGYAPLGLTSMEHVESIKPGATTDVLRAFGGDFAKTYIQGDSERFKELLRRSKLKSAKHYFSVLGENLDDFDKVLALDEIPSPLAIKYVMKNFPGETLDRTLSVAQDIDTENIVLFFRDFDSVEAFKALRTDYLEKAEIWRTAKGRHFDFESYELMCKYEGDPRFLVDFSTFDFHEGPKTFEELDQLSSAMSFEEYMELGEKATPEERSEGMASHYRQGTIYPLVKYGFTKDEICTILDKTGPFISVKNFLNEIGDQKVSLEAFIWGVDSHLNRKEFRTYGPFIGQIPETVIPALQARKAIYGNIRTFIESVGVKQYWSGEGEERAFDTLRFLKEYDLFHNLERKKEKVKKGR